MWSHIEAREHINYLKLLATFLGLKTFAKTISNSHIRLRIDNTSAVSINNMGISHSEKCNSLAKQVWEWCIERQIWISAAHIPYQDGIILLRISNREETKRHQNGCSINAV